MRSGRGYDSTENLVNGAFAAPLLIPVVATIVRCGLFLLKKLGGAGKAVVYAVVSGIVSLLGTFLIASVFYVAASLLAIDYRNLYSPAGIQNFLYNSPRLGIY